MDNDNKISFFKTKVIPVIGWGVVIISALYLLVSFGQALIGGYRYYHADTIVAVQMKQSTTGNHQTQKHDDEEVVKKSEKSAVSIPPVIATTTSTATPVATVTSTATCHIGWVDNKSSKPLRVWQYFLEDRRWVGEVKPGDRFGIREPLDFQTSFEYLKLYTEQDGGEGIYHKFYFPLKTPTEQTWDGRSQQ